MCVDQEYMRNIHAGLMNRRVWVITACVLRFETARTWKVEDVEMHQVTSNSDDGALLDNWHRVLEDRGIIDCPWAV